MQNTKFTDESEMREYLRRMRTEDPQFELKVEFGKLLMKPKETLNELETRRLTELSKIVKPFKGE